MNHGIFTISLDFELHWGGFEKWPLERYRTYFRNTRDAIPEMLTLFRKYEVHVTWATVGMLFHSDRESLLANVPEQKPSYETKELSAYRYIDTEGIGKDEAEDPFHYAPSLIREILATPFQELGTHTFAHYYCQERGQTVEQFQDDLRAAKRVALHYGVSLRSLVFPRNQFNDAYLKVCAEEGITSVRSNPLDWFWNIGSTQQESAWKRLNRGLDAYFPLGRANTYGLSAVPLTPGMPLSFPASRLLRPYAPRELFLNTLKVRRIYREMSRAAQTGEVYHLWWHPHNFGHYPERSLEDLEKILKHYAACRDARQMRSFTMAELADYRLHEK